MQLLLLIVACAPGPTVSPIEPGAVAPGEMIEVRGSDFGEAPRAFLEEGDTRIALPLVSASNEQLKAQVPRATELGAYDFVVRTEGGSDSKPVEVVAPDLERACHNLYRTEHELSASRKRVVLRRFFRDGREETEEFSTSAIEQVVLTSRPLEDGSSCAAVYLVTTEGLRLWMDEPGADLGRPARHLAEAVGVPLMDNRAP